MLSFNHVDGWQSYSHSVFRCVRQIAAGSPASKIGIQSGDRVTHVQGKSINKMTSSDVTALVNQQGCTLLLTVER